MKLHGVLVLAIAALQVYTSDAYRAKVVDFTPRSGTDPFDTMESNLKEMFKFVILGDDIVVFPEYGVTTLEALQKDSYKLYAIEIPEPKDSENLCETEQKGNRRILENLSCAAKSKLTYIVVNLLEKDPKKDKIIYNTNVVFARGGQIIAKYRKINLFGTEKKFLTPGTELVTFKTDFGVTFGTFTCFDILFKNPALDILTTYPNVTDIVYTTAWGSQLPFFGSLSVQDGYNKKTGVNLLASGYSQPLEGNGGSGIYRATGQWKVELPFIKANTPISDDLPIIQKRDPNLACDMKDTSPDSRALFPSLNVTQFKMKNDIADHPGHYNYFMLPVNERQITEKVCSPDGQLCCKFEVNSFNPLADDPRYAFLAHSHGRDYGCALVACQSGNFESCGSRQESVKNVQFKSISITTIDLEHDSVNMPITLNYDLKPLSYYTYCFDKEVTMKTEDQRAIVTFGFYISGASFVGLPSVLLVSLLSIFAVYFR